MKEDPGLGLGLLALFQGTEDWRHGRLNGSLLLLLRTDHAAHSRLEQQNARDGHGFVVQLGVFSDALVGIYLPPNMAPSKSKILLEERAHKIFHYGHLLLLSTYVVRPKRLQNCKIIGSFPTRQ